MKAWIDMENELTTLMTIAEEKELERLEGIIEIGRQSFIEVGMALTEIKNAKLYRKDYKTFGEYCLKKWQYARQTAYQFIDSVKVVENVRHGGQTEILPTNERQTRPLTSLEPEQQQEVWQKAVDTAPEGKVTARHIEETVWSLIYSTTHNPKPKTKNASPSIISFCSWLLGIIADPKF